MVEIHKWNFRILSFFKLCGHAIPLSKTCLDSHIFQLVYGLEVILRIECENFPLKLVVELLPTTSTKEEHFLHLACLDETRCNVVMSNKAHKNISYHNLNKMLNLVPSWKVIQFSCMTKKSINQESGNSNQCGQVHAYLNVQL